MNELATTNAFLRQAGQVFRAEARRVRFRQRSVEFQTHAKIAEFLDKNLNPDEAWWTSLENRPRSQLSGLLAKKRGCKSGLPDLFVLIRAPFKLVFVELKGPTGRPSKNQKKRRSELKAMGAEWWWARSFHAALAALRRYGAPFRKPLRLRPLEEWEGPFTGDEQRVARHPKAREQEREAKERRRQRRIEAGGAAPPRPKSTAIPMTLERRQLRAVSKLEWRRRNAERLNAKNRTPERRAKQAAYMRDYQRRKAAERREREAPIAAE